MDDATARRILEYVLGPQRPTASGGGSGKFTPRCFCGEVAVVPSLTQNYENNGDPASNMW